MKLGSLRQGGRDGALVVVRGDLRRAATAGAIAATMQAALDDWAATAPALEDLWRRLEAGAASEAFDLEAGALAAPLPRAYQFVDGSAYLHHARLVRRARGAELPERLLHDPLMYQAVSDRFMAATDAIVLASDDWGIDLEAEIAVIVDDVPMGVSVAAAADHIKLVLLLNDISLRGLIPEELSKGFGFLHGKPISALSPVAVTPDALGAAWDGKTLHRPLVSHVNGVRIGDPHGGRDMNFSFPQLINHAAKSRGLGAGTIVGSGTVSNIDGARGSSCLAEIRSIETIERGAPETPFLRFGDRVRIDMFDPDGATIFGAIDQRVVKNGGGR